VPDGQGSDAMQAQSLRHRDEARREEARKKPVKSPGRRAELRALNTFARIAGGQFAQVSDKVAVWRLHNACRGPMPDGFGDVPVSPSHVDTVTLRLRLIGTIDAWGLASERVLPRVRKTRGVLAVLALSAGRPVLRSRLTGLFWSTRDREQARASLRQSLHELGHALGPCGPVLVTTRETAMLVANRLWVDATEVLRLGPGEPAALDVVEGRLLEDLDGLDPAFDQWLLEERRRFRERARSLAEGHFSAIDPPEGRAVAARRIVQIDPAHEPGWLALMQALGDLGDRAGALEAFERCRASLAEFGTAPSPEVEGFAQRLRTEIRAEEAPRFAVPAGGVQSPRQPARGARIGVAPLKLLGSGAGEHLSVALADEITTALSRFRWLAVVSSASLGRLDDPTDTEAARRDLGLDLMLAGTVQSAPSSLPGVSQVRVALSLLDLRADAEVVWAQRFDRDSTDIFALQDEVAAEVVARVDPEILLIEARRAESRTPAPASAYDMLLRAIPALYRLDRVPFMEAGVLLAAAIAREPDYAAPHAWYAYWHMFLVGQGWADAGHEAMQAAGDLASRAVALDPADARGLTIAGHVQAYLYRHHDQAIALHERALSVNPNLPMAWVFSGAAHGYAGRHAEAIRRIERYRRLSPMDPHAFLFETGLMTPHILIGEPARAVAIGEAVIAMQPRLTAAWKPYAAALALCGREGEARVAARHLLSLEPGFTVAGFLATTPYVRPADLALLGEALSRAGFPGA
jgi:DNA-binding SARP family transcriptional activator